MKAPLRYLCLLVALLLSISEVMIAQPEGTPGQFSTGHPTAGNGIWYDVDIGTVPTAGNAVFSSPSFTVKGAGSIGNTGDTLHFVYRTLTGDGSITARVKSLQGTSFPQAGVMIRESMNPSASDVFLSFQPNSGGFQTRNGTGSSATTSWTSFSSPASPYWVRLVRASNSFTGYMSNDGVTWTQIGSTTTVPMQSNVYIGMGVANGGSTTLETAVFDNVSVNSLYAPAPIISSVSATTGSVGSLVQINGVHFGTPQGNSLVLLSGAPVTINLWDDTSILFTVPNGATSGPLLVSVAPSMNDSNAIHFSVTTQPLPEGWLDLDIGAVGPTGSATYSPGVFTLQGAGGINGGNTADALHFVYQPMTGDGTIVARVNNIQGSSHQAGVMIRETLDPGSRFALIAFNPNQGSLYSRTSPGGSAATQSASFASAAFPYWVKLTRSGNTLTGYLSNDGASWAQIATTTIAMANSVYFGLAVTGQGSGSLATATLDNVSLSSSVAPAPVITSISATTGPVGSQVQINGANFGATQGASIVTLSGTPAPVNLWSDTSITFTIPSGAASGFVLVSIAPSMNNSNYVYFTVTTQPLPSPWLDTDIGTVTARGSATYSAGVFTVKGSGGFNNGATADGLHFVYQSLPGDGSIVARVSSLQGSSFHQVGVMIRETLGATSTFALAYYSPNQAFFVTRTATGQASSSQANSSFTAPASPYWVKLTRSGSTFTGYASNDGSTWTQIAPSATINMASTVSVGLAVTPAGGTLETATLDNVSVVAVGTSPYVSGVNPPAGSVGTPVVISGFNFGSPQSSSTVTFNGVAATPTNWTTNSISTVVPTGTMTGSVVVQVGGVNSNANVSFTIYPAPVISSIFPTWGPPGTSITIKGLGFGVTQGSGTVSLGTTPAVVSSWSNTQLVASVASGSASGSAQVQQYGLSSSAINFSVTAPVASIALSPANPSITLNAAGSLQLAATATLSDSTTQDVTTLATWSSSNTSIANIISGPTVSGVVVGIAPGTATVTAGYNGLNATTGITVLASPAAPNPTITSISPTSGAPGTQVMINGTGFGANQGTSNVVVGNSLGIVQSWSDTAVSALVATGASSGSVQVQEGGIYSNAITFTVNNPTISGLSANNGVAGTQITFSGSGFGSSQGNGIAWLGTAGAIVNSWSDGQVVATVASGSSSGTAQILQNGVWSNSLTFTVNTPQITGITPTSGAAGTVVTITGSGFGTSQGSGTVWLGSTSGSVVGWGSNTITASVASSAVSGVVKVQQNGIWSNAITFTVPAGSGGQLTMIPNVLSMVVGDTHSIRAVNASGQSITGLSWTSSNTAIATLSTDDPPIITAAAPGNVTITAGSASADLTVYAGSLPIGTVIWSNPGDGSGVQRIVPAVPSATGVADVFATQADCSVQAITSDGFSAWTANAGMRVDGTGCKNLLPDFQGGMVVVDPGVIVFQNGQYTTTGASVQKFEGMTGQPYPAYSASGGPNSILTGVHTDGTLFVVNSDNVAVVDPISGTEKGRIPIKHNTWTNTDECGNVTNSDFPPYIYRASLLYNGLTIAGDGYAYVPYSYRTETQVDTSGCGQPESSSLFSEDVQVRLLRVGTDGSFTDIPLAQASVIIQRSGTEISSISGNPLALNIFQIFTITNADQGVLVVIRGMPPNGSSGSDPFQSEFIAVTNGTVTSDVTLPSQINYIEPILQAQDGTYYGDLVYDFDNGPDHLAKFDLMGNIQWSRGGYYAQIATADGGVITRDLHYPWAATIPPTFTGPTVTFDANGNQTGKLATLATQSWTSNGYQLGSIESIAMLPIELAVSFSPMVAGNASSNGTAVQPITQDVRAKIAETALSKVGSQNWLDQAGLNKCNIFVHDVLKEVGTTPPESDATSWKHRAAYYLGLVDSLNYPAQAGDWANPGKTLGCWKTVTVNSPTVGPPLPPGTRPPDLSIPGDVIAEAIQYSDATGHVGIIVDSRQTVSADSAVNCYNPPTPAGTITNSDYGFRPDDYVDPTSCRTHGLEKYAVVKRFVCQ